MIDNLIKTIRSINDGKVYLLDDLRQQIKLNCADFKQCLQQMTQVFADNIILTETTLQVKRPLAVFATEDFVECKQNYDLTVTVLNTCISTNSFLLNLLKNQKQNIHRKVVIANEQIKGRGRQNKLWRSQIGDSLIFSLGWQVAKTVDIQALPLIVAIAICKVLQNFKLAVKIKWPNDLVFEQAKLAGILVENVANELGQFVVIGVGMNYHTIDKLSNQAVSIYQLNPAVLPLDLMKSLLAELQSMITEFLSKGFKSYQSVFHYFYRDINQIVILKKEQDIVLQGRIKGVNDSGALLLQDKNDIIHTVNSGDISLQILK